MEANNIEITHRPAGYGAFQSRAFFSLDGQAFEACRFTRADGVCQGVEIYRLEANEPPSFLGYAETLYQLPAADAALQILAR